MNYSLGLAWPQTVLCMGATLLSLSVLLHWRLLPGVLGVLGILALGLPAYLALANNEPGQWFANGHTGANGHAHLVLMIAGLWGFWMLRELVLAFRRGRERRALNAYRFGEPGNGRSWPKRVFIVDELPRNAMGKVQKNELRKRYASTFSHKAR